MFYVKRKEKCMFINTVSKAFLKPIPHSAQQLFLPSNLECVSPRWSEKNLPSGRHKKITSLWGLPAATWTNAIIVELDNTHVITASEMKTPSGLFSSSYSSLWHSFSLCLKIGKEKCSTSLQRQISHIRTALLIIKFCFSI